MRSVPQVRGCTYSAIPSNFMRSRTEVGRMPAYALKVRRKGNAKMICRASNSCGVHASAFRMLHRLGFQLTKATDDSAVTANLISNPTVNIPLCVIGRFQKQTKKHTRIEVTVLDILSWSGNTDGLK